MRNLGGWGLEGVGGKLHPFNIHWGVRQQEGSNGTEQRAKIGKVMGRVQGEGGSERRRVRI